MMRRIAPHSWLFIQVGERNPITPRPVFCPKHRRRKEADESRKKSAASYAGRRREVMTDRLYR
jgi:hypothetical protein